MKNRLGLREEQAFDILISPVITEKSFKNQALNQYTFRVCASATKPQIQKAVERLYKVKVEDVRTLNRLGKTKRFRGRLGVRSNVKNAIIRVQAGHFIDTAATL